MGSLSSKAYCSDDGDDDDHDDDHDDDNMTIITMMTMMTMVMVRLKLVPDDRRCLQSPTLTGAI